MSKSKALVNIKHLPISGEELKAQIWLQHGILKEEAVLMEKHKAKAAKALEDMKAIVNKLGNRNYGKR
jgi:hypothetical protein